MGIWPSMLGTTFAVVIYIFIFVAIHLTDQLPSVPKSGHRHGLNLTQAWKDLHVISTRPHPYNSRANDLVHAFLLSRLEPLKAVYPHVHIVDDITSNATYEQIYFEGTNILVKVDGTEPHLDGAVLFSAHYDSVSTSYGTVDDGIAIVSMLQMVEKLSKTRSKRTAIFNFNNAEEDGLNGAHAFLEHPWSNLTRTFLNLEGASAGGRPILFQGTSTKPISAFHHIPYPHGTVLASDLYTRGLLRSRTDYTVYREGGHIEGLDLAFYKGRSSYHTKYDAIPFLWGGTRALWSMMEALDGAGRALLDQEDGEATKDAVYFDLFGRFMVIFSLQSMKIFNVVLLVMIPAILSGFYVWPLFNAAQTNHARSPESAQSQSRGRDLSWIRFWIALTMAIASQVVLVLVYVLLNKYVVYSFALTVYAIAISLAYLACAYPLTSLSVAFLKSYPASASAPNLLLLQLVIFSYSLLLVATVFIPIGGIYPLSALALCAFLGWIAGTVNEFIVQAKGHNNRSTLNEQADRDTEPTETTPLVTERSNQHPLVAQSEGNGQNVGIWFVQLSLVVPVPVALFAHLGMVVVNGMSQSITDGGAAWLTYAVLSLIAVFVILPLAPFIPSYPPAPALVLPNAFRYANSPKTLFRIMSAAFLAGGAYTFGIAGVFLTPNALPAAKLGFPFTIDSPVKIFFHQRVELVAPWVSDKPNALAGDARWSVRPITYLTGVPYYLDQMIVPTLPSAERGVECIPDGDRTGLTRCSWPSGADMVPSPGGPELNDDEKMMDMKPHRQYLSKNPWIQSSILMRSSTSARFWIRGTNTRTCRLYFDNARVAKWHVAGGVSEVQRGYEGFETKKGRGLTELRMWSRAWNREFVVDVDFVERPQQKINGSVACEWSEYESGRIGIHDAIPGGTIPAYEEALSFFPKWATLTKLSDGLVEVWTRFEL